MSYGEFRADPQTVGLWLMNGNANDNSGNANHGTVYEATLVYGAFGQAYNFEGDGDYINIPNASSLNITGDLTIELLIKATAILSANDPDIFTKGDYNETYSIWCNNYTRFVFSINNTRIYSVSGPSTTAWQYWAFVKSGTTGRIYCNGVQEATGTLPSTINTTTKALTISTATYSYYGQYDMLRLSNAARTAADIRQMYLTLKGAYGGAL